MKDKVATQDEVGFVLNGKPYVPGEEKPPPTKPTEETQEGAE